MKFCPQCHLLLASADCGGIPILVCNSCGGCWFSNNSLDDAVKNHHSALVELDTKFPGTADIGDYAGLTAYCPECRTQSLAEWPAPGVPAPLLECPKCEGVWVKPGLRLPLAESRKPESDRPAASKPDTSPPILDVAAVPSEASSIDLDLTDTMVEPLSKEPREVPVTPIDRQDYLAANEKYAARFVHGHLPRVPAHKLAIVTCMDARMQVYEILGLKPGDANIIRNAGGIVTEDVLRSLVVSHHLLGTKEVLIINHTDCGLLAIEEESFRDRLTDETGSAAIVPAVFHAFKDLEKNVRTQILKVRSHPWIPKDVNVRGFVYDVRTGRLNEVE